MPPKRWIDKKTAATYEVVQRSYEDPLVHDDEASQNVLVKQDNLNDKAQKEIRRNKWISGSQLKAQQDMFSGQGRRENEGQAALYGITFDDSKYDYMQHLKPMGNEGAIFIGKDGKSGAANANEPNAKARSKLGFQFKEDDAPKLVEAESTELELPEELLGTEIESSEPTWKRAYKAQQAIPDELKGLQPDMDPRLREVLEALDDDEYVEDETDDLFGELVADPETLDNKAFKKTAPKEKLSDLKQRDGEEDWEFEFRKFQLEQKQGPLASGENPDEDEGEDGSDFGSDFGSDDFSDRAGDFASDMDEFDAEEELDTVQPLPSINIKSSQQAKVKAKQAQPKKKKIGAKTDLTGFSMSSSANYRNQGLQLMDDRFDKIEAEYAQESEEEEEPEFDISKERGDFESIMDDFLDNYVVSGKKMWRK